MAEIATAPVSEVEEVRVIEALEWPCGYRNNAQSRHSCMNGVHASLRRADIFRVQEGN